MTEFCIGCDDRNTEACALPSKVELVKQGFQRVCAVAVKMLVNVGATMAMADQPVPQRLSEEINEGIELIGTDSVVAVELCVARHQAAPSAEAA